tara:strand:- start:624 stop:821 length:198 start_codon:yes stop_codon:yes gene_type:complete
MAFVVFISSITIRETKTAIKVLIKISPVMPLDKANPVPKRRGGNCISSCNYNRKFSGGGGERAEL